MYIWDGDDGLPTVWKKNDTISYNFILANYHSRCVELFFYFSMCPFARLLSRMRGTSHPPFTLTPHQLLPAFSMSIDNDDGSGEAYAA